MALIGHCYSFSQCLLAIDSAVASFLHIVVINFNDHCQEISRQLCYIDSLPLNFFTKPLYR